MFIHIALAQSLASFCYLNRSHYIIIPPHRKSNPFAPKQSDRFQTGGFQTGRFHDHAGCFA